MKYYKHIWEEVRGDAYDYWGHSTWYIEVGNDNYIERQIVHYEIGLTFKYSQEFPEDLFGGLGEGKFDPETADFEELSEDAFENLWISSNEVPIRVTPDAYNVFKKYNGEFDLLKDHPTGDRQDLASLNKYTFPLLNQFIDDLTCVNSGKYKVSLVQEMSYRLKILSPLVHRAVLDEIDLKTEAS